jgi:adenylyltransferase/sulfurtransferase
LGIGRPLTDRLLDFDARRTHFREIKVRKNPNCALCGARPTITELIEEGEINPSCSMPVHSP